MKSAGLSACFKEEGVIAKKMSMPTSPANFFGLEVQNHLRSLHLWFLECSLEWVKWLCSFEIRWQNTCQKYCSSNMSLHLHSKNQLLLFPNLGLCVSYNNHKFPVTPPLHLCLSIQVMVLMLMHTHQYCLVWCSAEGNPEVPCLPKHAHRGTAHSGLHLLNPLWRPAELARNIYSSFLAIFHKASQKL